MKNKNIYSTPVFKEIDCFCCCKIIYLERNNHRDLKLSTNIKIIIFKINDIIFKLYYILIVYFIPNHFSYKYNDLSLN